jgi:hypothetical protein
VHQVICRHGSPVPPAQKHVRADANDLCKQGVSHGNLGATHQAATRTYEPGRTRTCSDTKALLSPRTQTVSHGLSNRRARLLIRGFRVRALSPHLPKCVTSVAPATGLSEQELDSTDSATCQLGPSALFRPPFQEPRLAARSVRASGRCRLARTAGTCAGLPPHR